MKEDLNRLTSDEFLKHKALLNQTESSEGEEGKKLLKSRHDERDSLVAAIISYKENGEKVPPEIVARLDELANIDFPENPDRN